MPRYPKSKTTQSKQITKPFCRNLPRPVPPLSPAVMADPRRAAAIISTKSKWLNGTVLHYCFFGAGSHFAVPKIQGDAVRSAFTKWKAVGIGLEFQEVKSAQRGRGPYRLFDGGR